MAQTNSLETIVVEYLEATRIQDLVAARRYLSPDARFTTAGGNVFLSVEEMVEFSSSQKRWSKKRIENIDIAARGDLRIVYVSGTLDGETLDGRKYTGVRFIDRFTLRHRLILDHSIWNDKAFHAL